jgi:hypothetical protein
MIVNVTTELLGQRLCQLALCWHLQTPLPDEHGEAAHDLEGLWRALNSQIVYRAFLIATAKP